ncbi:16583_t:CDS:1, partial [Racocetra fulgida]
MRNVKDTSKEIPAYMIADNNNETKENISEVVPKDNETISDIHEEDIKKLLTNNPAKLVDEISENQSSFLIWKNE